MAYLAPQDEEEQNQQQGQEQGNFTQEKVIGSSAPGTVGGSSGGGQTAKQTQQGTKPSSSGSFTNLQTYLTANKGQDKQMAEKVGGTITRQADDATELGNAAASTTSTAINDGAVDTGLVQGLTTQIQQSPTTVKAEDFERGTQGYQGPQSIEEAADWNPATEAFNQVQNYANTATSGNFSDLNTITRDMFGDSRYTQGESNLDSWILGTGEQGRATLNDLGERYGTFNENLTGIQDTLRGQLDNTRERSDAASDQLQGVAESQLQTVQNQINVADERYGGEAAMRDRITKTTTDALTDNVISPDEAKAMGLSHDDYVQILQIQNSNPDFDMSQLFNLPSQVGLGDYVNTQDAYNYNALIDLLGLESGYDFSSTGNVGQGFGVNSDAVKKALQSLPQFTPQSVQELSKNANPVTPGTIAVDDSPILDHDTMSGSQAKSAIQGSESPSRYPGILSVIDDRKDA